MHHDFDATNFTPAVIFANLYNNPIIIGLAIKNEVAF